MLIPLSWIKEFAQVPQSATPQDISDCLVRVGFEVEGVTETGKDILLQKVLSWNQNG